MLARQAKGAARAGRDWAQALIPYRRASAARGVFELAVTFPPFVALWTAERIQRAEAVSIPSIPPLDAHGLRMEMVA